VCRADTGAVGLGVVAKPSLRGGVWSGTERSDAAI
jgi:hypothetical protein